MHAPQHAITVTRARDGWTWTVVDDAGATQAQGAAREQQAAMEAAWRAARDSRPYAPRAFPEITVQL